MALLARHDVLRADAPMPGTLTQSEWRVTIPCISKALRVLR